jgi:hypothetical protein
MSDCICGVSKPYVAQLVKSISALSSSLATDPVASFISTINKYVYVSARLAAGESKLMMGVQPLHCLSFCRTIMLSLRCHSKDCPKRRILKTKKSQIGFRISSLRISANIRYHYLQELFRLPISTLDCLPPGQTTAIITVTANILQIGISERLSSLIQAASVISIAVIIGCCFSWQLTLVTSSGLLAIAIWYSILTPLSAKRHAGVQKLEREAAGFTADALSSIKMIAACGSETKVALRYGAHVDKISTTSRAMSLVSALQHAPGLSSVVITEQDVLTFRSFLYHLCYFCPLLLVRSGPLSRPQVRQC